MVKERETKKSKKEEDAKKAIFTALIPEYDCPALYWKQWPKSQKLLGANFCAFLLPWLLGPTAFLTVQLANLNASDPNIILCV